MQAQQSEVFVPRTNVKLSALAAIGIVNPAVSLWRISGKKIKGFPIGNPFYLDIIYCLACSRLRNHSRNRNHIRSHISDHSRTSGHSHN